MGCGSGLSLDLSTQSLLFHLLLKAQMCQAKPGQIKQCIYQELRIEITLLVDDNLVEVVELINAGYRGNTKEKDRKENLVKRELKSCNRIELWKGDTRKKKKGLLRFPSWKRIFASGTKRLEKYGHTNHTLEYTRIE